MEGKVQSNPSGVAGRRAGGALVGGMLFLLLLVPAVAELIGLAATRRRPKRSSSGSWRETLSYADFYTVLQDQIGGSGRNGWSRTVPAAGGGEAVVGADQ